jgi:hypothetical protein
MLTDQQTLSTTEDDIRQMEDPFFNDRSGIMLAPVFTTITRSET